MNLEEPLAANANNINPQPGFFDHAFVRYYLFSVPTGTDLVSSIVDAVNILKQNSSKKDEESDSEKECLD